MNNLVSKSTPEPWTKNKIIGQKRSLKISHIWGTRIRLQLTNDDYIFKSRIRGSEHLSTRQYNRILLGWVESLGLDTSLYGTHSMRSTKPYLIYQKTKNTRVIQVLLGHKKLESTVRYLGIEVDDAIEISKSIEF